ncbi:MAG: ABC transporter substrate-binding protein [Candidatus Marithrix sp.]|nr:ABC transporter substrate-binding protein [Candidatus Marithrix sp.]
MKMKVFLVGMIILSAIIWLTYSYIQETHGKSIHIAFAGPLSGDGAAAGKLMVQAIHLYLDKINQKGGVNGKKIVLDEFDDQNNSNVAKEKALEIIEQNKAVAVIGHWYSSASISAGAVYKQHKIPAITPGSANLAVTKDNKWYFRNIYNATASGKFLANYVKNVFRHKNVTIIREKGAYGSYIAEVFEQESRKLGLIIKNNWQYDNVDHDLPSRLKEIVTELNAKHEDAGAILLAVQATEGVQLVKLIKDFGIRNTIIGASSLSETTFRDGFNDFPIENEYPGFYINDIYVATPLIFDTANEKAQRFKEDYQIQYDEEADWSAAYAYDSAMVVVEAIKKAEIGYTEQPLSVEREKIREALVSFDNVYTGIKGVTGLNYFDKQRDAQKPVSLGVYKNKRSVSALTQLQPVRSLNEISDLKQASKDEQVILIDGKYVYKTNVVYTGINFFNITEIDVKNLLVTLEFKLWFRFQGDFNPEDIEFSNTIEPDIIAEQLKNPIENKIKNKITYRVYRIKAKFKTDFISDYYLFKQHILGISFRHHSLTRNNLVYVTDVLGMGLTNEKELIQRLTKKKVINPITGWLMTRVWFFSQITREYSGGDPDHLNSSDGMIEYSRFNSIIQIKQGQFTLRGMVPYKFAYHLAIISALLFLLLAIITNKREKLSQLVWFFQVFLSFIFLLSVEVIIFSDWLSETSNIHQMEFVIRAFGILWWIIPAALINIAAERFIWSPLEEKVGAIPNIIRNFFAMVVYILAVTCIVVFVYEQEFTSLLATSGMLVMVIGLAIQVNISNVFSGIVINMERPFRIGDWIKISELEEGEVVDINWRATRIRNRAGCTLSIPNSLASESVILNFHYPDDTYWLWPTVYINPRHHPDKVKKILMEALMASEKIMQKPEPMVMFVEINEWSAAYWIAFCAKDYGDKNFILEDVWSRVWNHLHGANIDPAVMRQELHIFRGDKKMPILTEVDVPLPDKNKQHPFSN